MGYAAKENITKIILSSECWTVYKELKQKNFATWRPLQFDILKLVKTLKEAGVPERKPRLFPQLVQESHEAADLATKGDIADLRKESIPGLLAWMLSSKSLNCA